jgi:hypothetical protein
MNNYEAPMLVEIGKAADLILGSKPYLPHYVENEMVVDYYPAIDDIDETDE